MGGSGTAKARKLLSRWRFGSSLKLVKKNKQQNLFMWRTANMLSDRWVPTFRLLLCECAARLANSPRQCGFGPGRPKLAAAASPPRNVNDKDEQGNTGRQRGRKRRSCLKIQKDLMPKWIQQDGWGRHWKAGGGVRWKINLQGSFVACQSIYLPSLYEFYPTYLPCGPWISSLILYFVLFSLVWWLILHFLTFCHM